MRLYKYRGFSNLEFALDIFVNKRLYAASFQSLNDPMEGRFIYTKGILNKGELKQIRGEKAKYNILSLSETPNNMLMWSYYSEGHNGFVVGVNISDDYAEIEPVNYVKDLKIDKTHRDLAKSILTKKLKLWNHEKEHRVFKCGDPFVKVEVEELIFGLKSEDKKIDLLSKVAEKFCPRILIKQITKSELETGKVDNYEI